MRRQLASAIVALMMSGATVAYAQDNMQPSGMTRGDMPDAMGSPSAYVIAAGQSDKFEIKEGRLAETMGSTEKVRAFGRKMVKDHMKSTKIVMKAAMMSGLPKTPPPMLRPDQKSMIAQLKATSGPAFDQMYIQQQIQAHQQALKVQQGYAEGGADQNLKMAASKIVPVVQAHISMLQSMSSGM